MTVQSTCGVDKPMRHPDDSHDSPLLKRKVFWGECWVIQDIRDENTDMDFAPEPIDLHEAEKICETCRWFQVEE